jgi:hypothetical protein
MSKIKVCIVIVCLILSSIALGKSNSKFHVEFPDPPLVDFIVNTKLTGWDRGEVIADGLDKYSNKNSDADLAEFAVFFDYPMDAALGEIRSDIAQDNGIRFSHFLYMKMISESHCIKKYGANARCLQDKFRKADMKTEIKYLIEGRLYESDGAKCEAEKGVSYDLKILNISLEQYKKDKGFLPKDMQTLQLYMKENYLIKLRLAPMCAGYGIYKIVDGKVVFGKYSNHGWLAPPKKK